MGPRSPQSLQSGVRNTMWEILDIVCLKGEEMHSKYGSQTSFLLMGFICLMTPHVCAWVCAPLPALTCVPPLRSSTRESTLEIK